jgi:hypothetical protein
LLKVKFDYMRLATLIIFHSLVGVVETGLFTCPPEKKTAILASGLRSTFSPVRFASENL